MWTCNLLAKQQQGFLHNSAANARMQATPVRYLLISNAGQIAVCSRIELLLFHCLIPGFHEFVGCCRSLSRRPPRLPVRCSTGIYCCCAHTPPDCRTTLPKEGNRTPCLTFTKRHNGGQHSGNMQEGDFVCKRIILFLSAAEWPHDPKGPSTRLLCVAGAGQHAKHTARQQFPQKDVLWSSCSYLPTAVHGAKPLACLLLRKQNPSLCLCHHCKH